MRISYSAMDTFNRCPAKYKFQYIDRIKTPEKPELYFGSLIHEVVQFALKKDPIMPSRDELQEFFQSKWRDEVFSSPNDAKQYFDWGKQMLEKFHAGHKPGLRNIVSTEKRFQIPVGEHILSGMIDRIDKLPIGAFEVIDYKTSKTMPAQADVDRDKQLCIYHLAVENLWPEAKDIRLTLYYLKYDSQMTTKRRPDEVESIKEEIIKTAEKIEKEKEFRPKRNNFCDWCDFQHLCPLMKQKFQNQKTNIKNQNADEIHTIINDYLEACEKIKDLEPKINSHFDKEKIESFHHKKGVVSRYKSGKFTIRKN